MRLHFRPCSRGQAVCEAEVYFEASTPLAATRLCGFTVWKSNRDDGSFYVTLPSRPNSTTASSATGGASRFFDLIRAADSAGSPEATSAIASVKRWVLSEWEASGRPGAVRPD